jgi:hypothetical protein
VLITVSGTLSYNDTTVLSATYLYSVEAPDVIGQHSRPSEPAVGQAGAPLAGATASMAAPQAVTSALVAATVYDAKLKRYPYLTDLVNNPASARRQLWRWLRKH